VGSIEGRLQGEHERHCRAAAKDQEEDCKGCLIAFSSEYNRFRNQIQRSATRKSRKGPGSSSPGTCGSADQPETA
jgi:hypothetical protein